MIDAIMIAGTDTGVGKTVFSAALTAATGASYWKPIQAGIDDGGDSSRVGALLGPSSGRILPEAYRLRTPCSPHLAAELDGVVIDPERLRLPCSCGRSLVVEGAGGVLSPISRALVFADILARWRRPTVLVARTSLGTINHSLMSIEALRVREVPVHGIAFVGEANDDNELTIAEMSGVRRLGRLPWLQTLDRDSVTEAFMANFDVGDFT